MRGWATLTYNNSEKTALPCIFINPIETASTLKENIKQTGHLFFNSSQDKFYFVPAETRLIFWNKEAVTKIPESNWVKPHDRIRKIQRSFFILCWTTSELWCAPSDLSGHGSCEMGCCDWSEFAFDNFINITFYLYIKENTFSFYLFKYFLCINWK